MLKIEELSDVASAQTYQHYDVTSYQAQEDPSVAQLKHKVLMLSNKVDYLENLHKKMKLFGLASINIRLLTSIASFIFALKGLKKA